MQGFFGAGKSRAAAILLALDEDGECHFQVICKEITGTRSFISMVHYLEVPTQLWTRIGRLVSDSEAQRGASTYFDIRYSAREKRLTPRQLREIARKLTGAPFVTFLNNTGKHFREFDYPIEDTGAIECTIVAQHPVITVNALATLLWYEGNPMLEAMGDRLMGGDLIALGLRCLPPARKVVAGAGYFVICLVDYSIRVIGDVPASHLEPRWKFSDLLATYEIPGATGFFMEWYLSPVLEQRQKEKAGWCHISGHFLRHTIRKHTRWDWSNSMVYKRRLRSRRIRSIWWSSL